MRFVDLWKQESRQSVRDVLTVAAEESIGIVAGASSQHSEGAAIDFELLLLPLSHRGHNGVRVLGALAPIEVPDWFGAGSIGPLTLGALRYLGPELPPASATPLAPTLPRGRIRHGLMVYDGGQS